MPARARAGVRPHVRLRSSRRKARASRDISVPAIQPSSAPSATSASMARMLGNTAPRVTLMLPIAVRTRSLQRSVMDVPSSWYSAGGSLLHRAGDESPDQEALQHDDDQHGRNAREHRGGGDVAPRDLEDPWEERQRHRDRAARAGDGERVGKQELVPAEEKRQERRGGEPGRQQRDHDPPKDSEEAGPVHGRGLLGLDRDFADEPGEQPDRQRQRERGVHEDETRPRVTQIQRAHQEIERAHGRDLGKRRARDDGQQQQALARKREPGDRGRPGQADHQRQERGEYGHAEAVTQRLRHQALLDHDAVVRERQPAREQRRDPKQLGLGLEGRQQLPEEGDRVGRQRNEGHDVAERPDPPGWASHAATVVPARRNFRYAHATAMTRRNTTTLSAEPKPSWSVWNRARYA